MRVDFFGHRRLRFGRALEVRLTERRNGSRDKKEKFERRTNIREGGARRRRGSVERTNVEIDSEAIEQCGPWPMRGGKTAEWADQVEYLAESFPRQRHASLSCFEQRHDHDQRQAR